MSGTDPTSVERLIAELNLDKRTAKKVMKACLALAENKRNDDRPRGHGAPAQPKVTIADF